MRFENFTILYLLVLPLIAAGFLVAGIFLRRRLLGGFGKKETLDAQLRRPSPYLRAAKGITLVIGVCGLILAAARPQYGGRIRMLKKRGIDVVVALDFSKSMLAQDIQPSRLERAKLELGEFINQLTGDRIGLVAFAGDTMRFPVTTDYAAAIAFWKDLGPYDMPVGGTAIGKALTAAHRMLKPESSGDNEADRGRSKAILLLTDGEDHFGEPVAAAREAAADGIIVHVVGIGSDSPELIPRYLDDGSAMGYQKTNDGEYVTTALTPENEETLRQIASVAGGRYFRAGSDLKGMTAVVQEIRKMKQSDIESRQQEVYEDVFQWFLIPSFAVLLLAFLLPERMPRLKSRRRVPVGFTSLFSLTVVLAIAEPASAWEPFMSENGDVSDGNDLLKEGKVGDALKEYNAAAKALPNRGAVHLNRGLALSRMGDKQLDQAMQAFKLATDTEGTDAVRARAHYNLGNTFFKKEDYQEAIRQYKKSLMLAPGNKDAAWNLELARQKQKEKEEQQKKDQEKQDQQNQDQQNQEKQDQQNQEKQDQEKQDQQDEQKQDEQKQDEQKQDEQKQDEQKQDEQKQDEQKQDEQQQQQPQPQPKTKQEMEQLLDSLDKQPDNLQKQMAKQRGTAVQGSRIKDW